MARNRVFKDNDRLEKFDVRMAAENILIAKMFMYSAIKIRANKPAPYSILKPETNSDSPSAKSNGVRFVSASIVINQVMAIGSIIIEGHIMLLKV